MAARNRPTKASSISEVRRNRGASLPSEPPTYIELSDDLTVGVRLRNMEALIALDAIPNDLMSAALSMGRKAAGERTVEDFRESVGLQDVVCKNIIVEPEWESLDEIRDNGGVSDPDKLNLGMLTDDEIGGAFHLVYKGLKSWESFREQLRLSAVGDNGGADGGPAVELGPPELSDEDPTRTATAA